MIYLMVLFFYVTGFFFIKQEFCKDYRNDNCWGKNHKEEIHECKKNLCRKEN